MTKDEFQREERYVVFKLSDIADYFYPSEISQLFRLSRTQQAQRAVNGKLPLECVVVESDWPEYEPTWKAIEARVMGAQPAPNVPEGASFIDTSQLEGVVSTEIVHSYPPPSGWLRAIDEALVVTHLGVANASDTYEQAKAKLDSLIGFHVDVATDPAVNGGWKLMPVEPTKEIYECFSAYDGTSYSNPFDFDDFSVDYGFALEAAPEANP